MEKSILKTFRLAWLCLFLLLMSTIFSTYPIRDVISMQQATGFSLDVNLIYLAFAPYFNLLDMITALSLTQHVAWLIFILLLGFWLGFSCFKKYKGLVRSFIAIMFSIALVVLLYTAAMLMPRPMTHLVKPNSDILVVDFHSHTDASHDANKSFDAEDNRKWHRRAGFDAVFVTDHSEFAGVLVGKANNPSVANEGVLLMDGVEVRHRGGHVLAVCATQLKQVKADDYEWHTNAYGCKPLLVQANPGPITDSDARFKERSIEALEIHDGAPIALENVNQRSLWLDKAKSLNIAIVSGSDNHGWAHTASGWSVLNIKGWQVMNADALALAITQSIRMYGFDAVRVIERNMVLPAHNWLGHILMPVKLIWRMLQTLSWQEKLSWLVWILFFVFLHDHRQRYGHCSPH